MYRAHCCGETYKSDTPPYDAEPKHCRICGRVVVWYQTLAGIYSGLPSVSLNDLDLHYKLMTNYVPTITELERIYRLPSP